MANTRSSSKSKSSSEATYENTSWDLERLDTGLYSFNSALGGGLPLRSITEVSGWEFSGKTSLCLYLSAIADLNGLVGMADLEPFQDLDYLKRIHKAAGFTGTFRFAKHKDGKKIMTSEGRMDDLADMLYEPNISVIVLDSVGALYPISEEQGKMGEARVGERARLMKPWMSKIQFRLNQLEKPAIALLTNHQHAVIGGRGSITSGGKAVHYLSVTRLKLTVDRSEEENGLWIINGKVFKRRVWGIDSPLEDFQVALVPGFGVNPGLTAVLDCLTLGLAKKDRTITLGSKSFGYMKALIEKHNDPDQFKPFQEALKKNG